MTIEETAKIIDILQLNYPDSYRNKTDEETLGTVKLWQAILAEDSYKDVQAAVLAHMSIDTNRFMPPVGAIKQRLMALRSDGMTELEAWSLVSKAIRRSGYNAEEEYNKLPPVCQKVVGSPSQLHAWAIDEDFNAGVAQSNFMRSFRVKQQQEREILSLPPASKKVLGLIEQCSQQMIGGSTDEPT